MPRARACDQCGQALALRDVSRFLLLLDRTPTGEDRVLCQACDEYRQRTVPRLYRVTLQVIATDEEEARDRVLEDLRFQPPLIRVTGWFD